MTQGSYKQFCPVAMAAEILCTRWTVVLLRKLDPNPLPKRRSVIQFQYPGLPAGQRSWWLLVDPDGGVDLCSIDPGFDVDLYVSTDLRTMTAIWMGLDTVRNALRTERMLL